MNAVDNFLNAGAWPKHGRHTLLSQLIGVVRGYDAPDKDGLVHTLGAHFFLNRSDQGYVSPRENAEAHDIDVLLEGRLHHHFRCLMQASIDDFKAGIPQSSGDDFRSTIVSI